jgi:hypothetical protein
MKYTDGQEILVGDRVRMGGDAGGIVVCDIGSGIFSPLFPQSEWAYLKEGVVIAFPQYGVVHLKDAESDLELLARSD